MTPDTAPQTPLDFGARSPWSAMAALVFACIALATAAIVAVMAGALYFHLGNHFAGDQITMTNTMLATAVLQAVTIAFVWWGAARFGGTRQQVLSLPANLPLSTLLFGVAGMVGILAPYNLAIYLLWPAEFAQDLRPYADLAQSSAIWLGALVLVVGAPLWEETLFRGFLLPALTKTRHGFRGAAVITTLAWTAMHYGYSSTSLIEILMIGCYFSWLMWKFGNLWLTIALHALYNGLQLLVLAFVPASLAG